MPLEFEQQPKESNKAFAAFSMYLSLGPQRSLDSVARKLSKSEGLIARWSSRWRWTERVSAHASHLAMVEREATEALARSKSAVWLTRKEEEREEEWALRRELITASREVLKRFTEQGKGATLGDVARALDLACKLGRLACGMATDKTEITGEDGGPIQVELSAALNKIYGQAEPAPQVLDAEVTPESPLQLTEGKS